MSLKYHPWPEITEKISSSWTTRKRTRQIPWHTHCCSDNGVALARRGEGGKQVTKALHTCTYWDAYAAMSGGGGGDNHPMVKGMQNGQCTSRGTTLFPFR